MTVNFSDVITYEGIEQEAVVTTDGYSELWMNVVAALDHVSRMYDIEPGQRDGVVIDAACDVFEAIMNGENPSRIVWSDFSQENYRGVRNRFRHWARQDWSFITESQIGGEEFTLESLADAMMAAFHETQVPGSKYSYPALEVLALNAMETALEDGDMDRWTEINGLWEAVAMKMNGEYVESDTFEYEPLQIQRTFADRIMEAYEDPKQGEAAARASAVAAGYTDEWAEALDQQLRQAAYLAEDHIAVPPHSEPEYRYDDNEVEGVAGYLRDSRAPKFVFDVLEAIDEATRARDWEKRKKAIATAKAAMKRVAELTAGLSPTEKAGVVLAFAGDVAGYVTEETKRENDKRSAMMFGRVRSMMVDALVTDEEVEERPKVLNEWAAYVAYLFKEDMNVASMVYNGVMGPCKHGIARAYCSQCETTSATVEAFSLDDEDVFNKLFPSGSLGVRHQNILPRGTKEDLDELVDWLVVDDYVPATSPDWKPWFMEAHIREMVRLGLETRYSFNWCRKQAEQAAKKATVEVDGQTKKARSWSYHQFWSSNPELAPVQVTELKPAGVVGIQSRVKRLIGWENLVDDEGELRVFLNFGPGKKGSFIEAIQQHLGDNDMAMAVANALGR